MSRVYPRLRGGTDEPIQPAILGMGLSPLARGNRLLCLLDGVEKGSIPACAGEPISGAGCARVTRVYPRLRGGTSVTPTEIFLSMGLSPLARGNRPLVNGLTALYGSIPACAGEPRSWPNRCLAAWVYPRLRGGTALVGRVGVARQGLSPLARGNPLVLHRPEPAVGSIPACAGEPQNPARQKPGAGVYPRLRGGTHHPRFALQSLEGLSPLARGNPQTGTSARSALGSIPACAGEPLDGGKIGKPEGVYPRLRGGTTTPVAFCSMSWGLSPLARGNRFGLPKPLFLLGSIPACAGEPTKRDSWPLMARVYPRLRGGTNVKTLAASGLEGLSPLARGNLVEAVEIGEDKGSIPACAGEPKMGWW